MDKINILTGLVFELLTWRSILDILVMAVLVFFLYRTFVRLGTVKIVLGIILTIGVFILASFLDLTGIRWIYSKVSF
jgi:diadenylate cyclase